MVPYQSKAASLGLAAQKEPKQQAGQLNTVIFPSKSVV